MKLTVNPITRHSTIRASLRLRVICAWCDDEIQSGSPPENPPQTSHGICRSCAARYFGMESYVRGDIAREGKQAPEGAGKTADGFQQSYNAQAAVEIASRLIVSQRVSDAR